ncbi:MAG: hypothetical protein HC933_09435 [Pleurocapsa sp. SU_196_0]|nr:hypothetical protein [Pleurocapsa sp. SU_196_0]
MTVPTPRDTDTARRALEALQRHPDHLELNLKTSDTITAALRELLEAIASGKAVAVLPLESELSTFELADLLGVSRPPPSPSWNAVTSPTASSARTVACDSRTRSHFNHSSVNAVSMRWRPCKPRTKRSVWCDASRRHSRRQCPLSDHAARPADVARCVRHIRRALNRSHLTLPL